MVEKTDIKGAVSTDPLNHEKMVQYRRDKVLRVANDIPEQEVFGEKEGDLLVVSWGGTYGQTMVAVKEMQQQGQKVSLAHFKYISPLPKNTAEILASYKKIVVCELNAGQFVNYLRAQFPQFKYEQYNKFQGLPFTTAELTEKFNQIIKEK